MPNTLFHLQFPAPEIAPKFNLETFFESLDGWTVTPSGSGTISFDSALLTIDSVATAFSGGTLRKYVYYPIDSMSWSKNRTLEIAGRVEYGNEAGATLYLVMGYNPLTGHGIGFFFTDTKIIGRMGNASAYSSVDLLTGLSKPWSQDLKLKIVFTSPNKAEFYIAGEKKGELTTNYPTQQAASQIPLTAYIVSVGAITHKIKLSHLHFEQDL